MKHTFLLFMAFLQPVLFAQNAVPAGAVLPLRLDTGLNADHVTAGKVIRAELMQSVPGTTIHKGSHVVGHVVSVTPTRLELRFETLVTRQTRIPVTTDLRALASNLEVEEAQTPEGGADRSLPSALDQNTRQIGGEEVYRGGGPVARGDTPVAEPTADGALGRLNRNPPCRGAAEDNNAPQALWLFSTDACGLYGFDNLSIEHSGRTAPVGTIVLASNSGKLNIRTGSGLLLRVEAPH
jgi:hypothetical protein